LERREQASAEDTPKTQTEPPHVPLASIFWIFFQIGGFSFGGGVSAWLYREFVERRRWLAPTDFLGGMTLAQVLPGINMSNLSIYIGQRLRGVQGAVTAFFGLMTIPFFAVIALATFYAAIEQYPEAGWFLSGLATAAVGLFLSTAVHSAMETIRTIAPAVIIALLIVLVGILKWPMIPVTLALAPVSIWFAWRETSREASTEDPSAGGSDNA